jgi:hypothetical protein
MQKMNKAGHRCDAKLKIVGQCFVSVNKKSKFFTATLTPDIVGTAAGYRKQLLIYRHIAF